MTGKNYYSVNFVFGRFKKQLGLFEFVIQNFNEHLKLHLHKLKQFFLNCDVVKKIMFFVHSALNFFILHFAPQSFWTSRISKPNV